MGKEPEEEGKGEAEDEAGDDGNVEGGVFAAMNDVAGKATEPQGKFAAEIEKGADQDEEGTEEEESAAEIANWVHGQDCSDRKGVKERRKYRNKENIEE
ncbi:MAG TPA: hypothetical protein VH110_05100 [Candidatus Acidoferrum sp.]|nr:hypothetical protein [Candidatus Acidoferrum sp.]